MNDPNIYNANEDNTVLMRRQTKAFLVILAVSILVPIALIYFLKPNTPEAIPVAQEMVFSDDSTELLKVLDEIRHSLNVEQVTPEKEPERIPITSDNNELMKMYNKNTLMLMDAIETIHFYLEANDTATQNKPQILAQPPEPESEPEPLTVKWMQSPVTREWKVSEMNQFFVPTPDEKNSYQYWPSIQFGLREDGVVIWRHRSDRN